VAGSAGTLNDSDIKHFRGIVGDAGVLTDAFELESYNMYVSEDVTCCSLIPREV